MLVWVVVEVVVKVEVEVGWGGGSCGGGNIVEVLERGRVQTRALGECYSGGVVGIHCSCELSAECPHTDPHRATPSSPSGATMRRY